MKAILITTVFVLPDAYAECIGNRPCIRIERDNQEVLNSYYSQRAQSVDEASQYISEESDRDIDNVIDYAKSFIGVPYLYGGEDERGIDCSAFVRSIFKYFGHNLPRTSYQQYKSSQLMTIAPDELRPMDLVFFKSPKTKRIDHVALYIGDDLILHSSRREGGVYPTFLSQSPFWRERFYRAKRFKL